MKKTLCFLLALSLLLSLASCTKPPLPTEVSETPLPEHICVTPENPTAYLDYVTVDMGQYTLDGEEELTVTRGELIDDPDGQWEIDPFEVQVGSLHELDDFVTLRIRYADTFCDAGEDPSRCVGAKYLNEAGEWEDILYTVDAAAHEVVIQTDHFSTFGVFYVKNEGLRKAYLTKISDDIDYLSETQAAAVLQGMVDGGGDAEATKAGVAALGSISDLANTYGDLSDAAENTVTILSLGSAEFDDLLPEKAADVLGGVGKAASAIKIAKCILSDDASDKMELYKQAVSYLIEEGGEMLSAGGSAAFAVALSAVWVFDKVIGAMFEEAKAIKMEQMGAVYEYYNDQYNSTQHTARTLKDWRRVLIDITEKNADDPEAVQAEIDKEIDRYAREFWSIGGDTLGEVEDDAGFKRMPFPTLAEQETLTEQYKQNLYTRLYPVTTSVRVYFENKAKTAYLKELEQLRKFYNQKITFTATEEIEPGQASEYAGCTWGFGDLSPAAQTSDWIGATVKEDGVLRSSFTLLGYLMAGCPNELRLYAPGDDYQTAVPALAVPFTVSAPEISVTFGGAPTLEELLGEYSGDITLLACRVSDEGFAAYNSEEGEVELTRDQCDEQLSAYVADGTLSAAQTVRIESDDPASGKCRLIFTICGSNTVPAVPVEATYHGGVFTVACADGTEATVTATETGGIFTLSCEKLTVGIKDEEEYGDLILLYFDLSCLATK